MPRGRFFSYDVYIGKKRVHEVCGKDGNAYIETDLNVPGVSFTKEEMVITKHGEEERQSWPVTPYRVVVTVDRDPYNDVWYWFDMFVDGSRVWNKPLRNGRNMTVRGTMDNKVGAFRELLFSLPRYQQSQSDQIEEGRHSEIGSITITCKEAIFSGYREKTFRVRDESRRGQGASERSDFYQATKADCSGGGLMTTAPGRELYRFTDRVERVGRETLFKRGRLLEEMSVHYRMRQELVDMGLMKEPTEPLKVSSKTDEKGKKVSEEKNSRDVKAKHLSDVNNNLKQKLLGSHLKRMDTLSGTMEQLIVGKDSDSKSTINDSNCKSRVFKNEKVAKEPFKPDVLQPIKTRVLEEVIVRKNEKGEDVKMTRRTESIPLERFIRVDDDIYIVESLDDSVVYIGDDECYVVEPPVQEFPYVELE